MDIRHDPITWHQIGIGYVIVLCTAGGLATAALIPAPHPWALDLAALAVLLLLYGLWKLVLPLLRLIGRGIAPGHRGQQRLKLGAIAMLCLFSITLCAAAIALGPVRSSP